MGNLLRAIGISLCAVVNSAYEIGPFCGERFDMIHQVQAGENLWSLSKRFFGTTQEFLYRTGRLVHYPQVIARANGLRSYEVQEGMVLLIPRGDFIAGGFCPADTKAERASEYFNVNDLGTLRFP